MEKNVKLGFCCVCTRQCPMDVTIEDGRAVSVTRTQREGFDGAPCIKGLSMPEYIYHRDRVLYPLRRVGERGEGKFERISWEEALGEIAERLNAIKARDGAHSVAFYSGYSKWYRTLLQRLAYSFGSINYGTESSSCFRATVLASWLNSGFASMPDEENAGVLIRWTCSGGVTPRQRALRERGMKLIIVEPNNNPGAERECDLWLHILPGTDGALAWGLANIMINAGAVDEEYIAENCLGYEEYKAYAARFTPEYTAEICGITVEEVKKAGELICGNLPLAQQLGNAGLIHHYNGVQNYRAIECLSAISGCFDRVGGNIPAGDIAREPNIPKGIDAEGFFEEKLPRDGVMIGAGRFPVWAEKIDEFQAMDMARQIEEGTPYPLSAIFALGLNVRMFPNDGRLFEALKKIDFFVDADLFLTDTAKYADIVLPVCSSFERDQFMDVGGMGPGRLWYQRKLIEPLGESISDDELIKRVAEALELDDPQLRGGFEAAYGHMMAPLPFTMEELKASDKPIPVVTPPMVPGERTKNGFNTPSGKFELKSTVVEKYPGRGLNALPEYVSSLDSEDESFPLILVAGVRYAHVVHSRTHRVESLRKLRPFAAVDVNPEDAAALGLADGDDVRLATRVGHINVKVCVAPKVRRGTVNMYHGYPEADVNSIIPDDCCDPYSGFPNYRTVRCRIEKR